MCIPLHPYAVSRPHRIDAFEEAIEYITGHDDVWVTTGREIAEYYFEHHYDTALAAIVDHQASVRARGAEGGEVA
jgi:hypothetical protein